MSGLRHFRSAASGVENRPGTRSARLRIAAVLKRRIEHGHKRRPVALSVPHNADEVIHLCVGQAAISAKGVRPLGQRLAAGMRQPDAGNAQIGCLPSNAAEESGGTWIAQATRSFVNRACRRTNLDSPRTFARGPVVGKNAGRERVPSARVS